jgi:hypothetical protein
LSFNPKTKTKPSNRNKTNAKKKPQTVCNRNKNPEKEPPAQRGKYLTATFNNLSLQTEKKNLSTVASCLYTRGGNEP